MKSSQLITICVLHVLHVLTQIESQTQIARCGRLGSYNLIPFLTNSIHATHHWPWHAALYHKYDKKSNSIYQCGGTVISPKSVLTAGHCVSINNEKLDVDQVSISLGRLNLDTNENSEQWFGVSEILVHPNFNSIDYVNDIAIIRLSGDASFNNYVQPICLWKSDRTDISEVWGKVGTVVGWGLTENGNLSNVLQQANFPVVDFHTCLKSDRQFFGQVLLDTNFCAGSQNDTGVCQGDSGGSITFEDDGTYYIRGIVSFGQGKKNLITQKIDCDPTKYAVFTDVAKYLPWIKEILECETKLSCQSRLPIVVNRETEFSGCGQLSPSLLPLMTYSYDTHHWPWHAAIYHKKNDKSDRYYKCGGTVISYRSILTAADCVETGVKNISVSLGRLNLGANENSDQSFEVAEVIIHPNYNQRNYKHNIAIIKLATKATFNHYVQPVCLWNSDITEPTEVVGKSGTVVGWGLTQNGTQPNVLQQADLPVVDFYTCLESRPEFYGLFLSDTNFCASSLNGTSVCTGDTGGSITFKENGRYYIRGIVSVSASKLSSRPNRKLECDTTQYTVFTDVAKYLQWIKDNEPNVLMH